jgi:hypothetical protein
MDRVFLLHRDLKKVRDALRWTISYLATQPFFNLTCERSPPR